MSDASFKPGDTVRLKSGGPLMTVKAVEGSNVFTIWFEGTKKKESSFPAISLKHDDGGPVIA
jgi:uncharacterized protein YodC (DUF2158 family)